MSVSRAQKIRLGIFVVVSMALLAGMLVVLVGGRLTEKEDLYYARFDESVSGLEVGAPVKYHGVRIGGVTTIEIDREDVSLVRVKLSLQKGTPIKADSVVVLNSMGITGLKFLELTGGTNESSFLQPGSEIKSGASLLDRLTGKADVITEKIELLINNALAITGPEQQEQVKLILEDVRSLLETTDELVTRNEVRIDQLIDDLSVSATNLREFSQAANKTLGRFDEQMAAITNDLDMLLLESRVAVQDQNHYLALLLTDADATVLAAKELLDSPSMRRVPRKVDETVSAALELVQGADRRTATLLGRLTETAGRLDALLGDQRVEGMLDSLARLSKQLEGFVDTLDLTMRQSREDIFATLTNLKDVVRNLNDFTQMLLESPSILLRGSQLKERSL